MSDLRKQRQAKRLDRAARSRVGKATKKLKVPAAITILTVAIGLGANYRLSKIEWAAGFWLISLVSFTYLAGKFPWVDYKLSKRWRLIFQFVLAIAVLGFLYLPVRGEYQKQHAALMTGVLEPLSRGVATKPTIEVGDAGYMIDMSTASPNEGIRLLQDEHLRIEVQDGVPLISTIIRDRDSKVLLKIERNHWEVSPPPLTMDKNYTNDRLEVKDLRDRVVFRARVLPDRVQVEGEWRDDTGFGVRISAPEPGMVRQGGMGISLLRPRSLDPQGIGDALGRIPPAFRYPSSEHWGELIAPKQ